MHNISSEIFTVVIVQIVVLVLTLCSPVGRYQSFRASSIFTVEWCRLRKFLSYILQVAMKVVIKTHGRCEEIKPDPTSGISKRKRTLLKHICSSLQAGKQ
jgi:hypothetical protein